MTSHDFRRDFDLDESLIYLNSGTQSICPRNVLDATIQNLRTYERNPTHHLVHAWDSLWKVQSSLAKFLGAQPQDLFLRPNVTSVMNDFVLGTPLPQDSEILVSDAEYGAIVNLCRYRAERDGLSLRSFHVPGTAAEMKGLTAEKLTAQIKAQLRPETKMLVLSHVMTGHGLTLPLELIAKETRERNVLFVVDGAHGVGAIPIDFARLDHLDFYAGNLHKWTLGPKGTAFGWTHPTHQDHLAPSHIGWTTFEAQAPYHRFGDDHRFAQKHLHAACVDFAPLLALQETFSYWDQSGADEIRSRIRELQSCVEEETRKHTGWDCISPTAGSLRGPLLAFETPEKIQSQGYALMERLFDEKRLQISMSFLQNRWVMRISPHIYNTEAEIKRAAQIIAAL